MRALWAVALAFVSLAAGAQSQADPRVISIHPFTGRAGAAFTATVRGAGLVGATGASTGDAPLKVSIEGSETEPAAEATGPKKTPVDLVKIRVEIASGAKPGRYPVRFVTPKGVSNALALRVVDVPVLPEPAGAHESRGSAVQVSKFPVAYAGRLSHRGEADYYSFRVTAGQTLTFQVISGLPQIAAGGSAATVANFDPALTIYEPAGSWFDPQRLDRIAYNDEPVWVFGKPTDAHLVYRFPKAGEYLLRIEAFAGQGGPDYAYELKIASGTLPPDWSEAPASGWDERGWSRRLAADRLSHLAARGGVASAGASIETYRAAPEPVNVKLPATVEGTLAQPGETHRARFHLDKPGDIAIEIETPAAAPPFFNPILRLLNGAGEEVASNILAGLGACSGAMTKAIEAKTVLPLRETGDYTIEIRDTTADLAGQDFQYRVQIRPQVPHVGNVQIETDVVNLTQGEAKLIRVGFDREEDYRGSVLVAAESLPPGVMAQAGADFEPDKDAPPKTGKRERYTPRTERLVLVLAASAGAPPSTDPRDVRLVVRPVVDGRPGEVLFTKTVPLMVLRKP